MLSLKALLVASGLISTNAAIMRDPFKVRRGGNSNKPGPPGPPGPGRGPSSSTDGLGPYECQVLLSQMAPDLMEGVPCPFESEVDVLCEAPCVQQTVNAFIALEVAGCPADLFHCDGDCDDGEACNDNDGECYPRCMESKECGDDTECRDGMCMYPGEGEEPFRPGDLAMMIAGGCIRREGPGGQLCFGEHLLGQDDYFKQFDYNFCQGFRSLGCCVNSLFMYDPSLRDLCQDETYNPGPECDIPEWVDMNPEINEDDFNGPWEDFCSFCQPSNWNEDPCVVVARFLCDNSDDRIPYCRDPLCEDYDELDEMGQGMCHARARQFAAFKCGGDKCAVCGPNGKPIGRPPMRGKRQLNFMTPPLPCC